jgi:hypothetical protein
MENVFLFLGPLLGKWGEWGEWGGNEIYPHMGIFIINRLRIKALGWGLAFPMVPHGSPWDPHKRVAGASDGGFIYFTLFGDVIKKLGVENDLPMEVRRWECTE